MSNVQVLEGIELIPVLELVPSTFATQSRSGPSGTFGECPDEWNRYWSDSLADSGILGLRPIRRGSWHVATKEFADSPFLQKFLEKTFQEWGGIKYLSDPVGQPVLSGGLSLQCLASDVLIEPSCCADLAEANWNEAVGYRGSEWKMLWIGHPWLSMRYQSPSLIFSEPHESNIPSDRWAISPDELSRAFNKALVELERFAGQLTPLLLVLGYQEDPESMARKLAGLKE